ncbi:hypothetical protein [Mucilaginibacter sp. HD30]
MPSIVKTYYEFINVQTGNVIAHLSIPVSLDKPQHAERLNEKKILLATSHKLGLDKIYWQDRANPISNALPKTVDKGKTT